MSVLLNILYRLFYVIEVLWLLSGLGLAVGLGVSEQSLGLFGAMLVTLLPLPIVHFVFTMPIAQALEREDFLVSVWKRLRMVDERLIMPTWLRNLLVFFLAFVIAGIWGAVAVLLGIPDILTAVGVVIIGGISMAWVQKKNSN